MYSVVEEKSSYKMLRLTFSTKLDWILSLSLFLKLPPRKLEPWFVLWSFFLRLLCISINLPFAYVWNTVVTSGLLHLVANFSSIWVFFHKHLRITGLQGKEGGAFLHLLATQCLDISRVITEESSPLHIASSRSQIANLWFLSASH